MENRDCFIHLGFPKTATTAFQQGIFQQDRQVAYLGKRARSEPGNRVVDTIVNRLLWSSVRYWRENGAQMADELSSAMRSLDSGATGPLLISDERLLGGCLGVFRVANRWQEGRVVGLDPDSLAERLGAFARYAWPHGRVRVLLTLRRQDRFLASLFAQTFLWRRSGGTDTLEQFAEVMTDRGYYSMGGVTLDYAGLIEQLEGALGAGSVEVMFYEDIAADLERIIGTLERTVNASPELARQVLGTSRFKIRNVGEGAWAVRRFRGSNRARHLLTLLLERLQGRTSPAVVRLTPELSRMIMERYSDSNQRLAKRLGRDLSAYGYTPTDEGNRSEEGRVASG